MTEGELARNIIEAIHRHYGGFFLRITNQQDGSQMRGVSDIHGTLHGQSYWFEVKLPKTRSRVTPTQHVFLSRMREHGAVTGVITSVNEGLKSVRSSLDQQLRDA